MSRVLLVLTYTYAVIAFLAVLCCYASFVFLLASKNWSEANSEMFSGFSESWNNDVVFNVRATNKSAYLESPDHYFTVLSGKWPGVIEGCDCPLITDPNLPKRVEGLLRRKCTLFEEVSIGCKQVSSVSSINMTNWITPKYLPMQFFVVRVKNTSFKASIQNMKEDGSCKDGFRNCGDPKSLNGGYCIKNELECPWNDIQNQKGKFKRVSIFEPIDIYYSTDVGQNPINDLYISEEFLCFNRAHTSFTPNASLYELQAGDSKNCINDTLAWWVTEQPQKAIFDMNKIPYEKITGYAISEDAKYRLFAARVPEWSRKCNSKISDFEQALETFANIKGEYRKLYELSTVCSTAALVSFVFTSIGLYANNIWLYIVPFVPRAFFWVILTPKYPETFKKVAQLVELFLSVEAEQCSNPPTNQIYTQMGTTVAQGMLNKDKIVPLGHYAGFGLEILNLILALVIVILRRKLAREANKGTSDLADIGEGMALKPEATPTS